MAYAKTPTGALYYEVSEPTGGKPPRGTIIFHHGIGAFAEVWDGWLPQLVDGYRVVKFDMRGYGRSHSPGGGHRWTLDGLVDDLIAVADAAAVERAHLVGESIGGTIVLRAAIRHPQRVATLTVSNGADVGAPLQKVHAWQKQIDELGIKAWSEQFMRDRFYDDALTPQQWQSYAAAQEAWTRDSILSALSVLVGTDLRADMPEIACRVLLLHGDSSPFIPVRVMVEMHERLRDSRLQVFAHAKHGLPYSHGPECAALLRKFLDGAL